MARGAALLGAALVLLSLQATVHAKGSSSSGSRSSASRSSYSSSSSYSRTSRYTSTRSTTSYHYRSRSYGYTSRYYFYSSWGGSNHNCYSCARRMDRNGKTGAQSVTVKMIQGKIGVVVRSKLMMSETVLSTAVAASISAAMVRDYGSTTVEQDDISINLDTGAWASAPLNGPFRLDYTVNMYAVKPESSGRSSVQWNRLSSTNLLTTLEKNGMHGEGWAGGWAYNTRTVLTSVQYARGRHARMSVFGLPSAQEGCTAATANLNTNGGCMLMSVTTKQLAGTYDGTYDSEDEDAMPGWVILLVIVLVIVCLCCVITKLSKMQQHSQGTMMVNMEEKTTTTTTTTENNNFATQAPVQAQAAPVQAQAQPAMAQPAAAMQPQPVMMAQPAQQPAYQDVVLSCPPGVWPGQYLQVGINQNGRVMMVTVAVPPGVQAGQQFVVRLATGAAP